MVSGVEDEWLVVSNFLLSQVMLKNENDFVSHAVFPECTHPSIHPSACPSLHPPFHPLLGLCGRSHAGKAYKMREGLHGKHSPENIYLCGKNRAEYAYYMRERLHGKHKSIAGNVFNQICMIFPTNDRDLLAVDASSRPCCNRTKALNTHQIHERIPNCKERGTRPSTKKSKIEK